MKREILWVSLVSAVFVALFFVPGIPFHESYLIMVAFFFGQTLFLVLLDVIVPKEWSAEASLVKIVLRLLSSLAFITVLMYTMENLFELVIQFVILYLVFMVFEIVTSLHNLRRNSDKKNH